MTCQELQQESVALRSEYKELPHPCPICQMFFPLGLKIGLGVTRKLSCLCVWITQETLRVQVAVLEGPVGE